MKRKESYMGYLKPEVQAIRLDMQSQLMDTSFPSQHKPGHHGTGPSSAKEAPIWEEEEEEEFED